METRRTGVVLILLWCSLLISSIAAARDGNHLHVGFYSASCPSVEKIISSVVTKEVECNSTLPAGLIRLFFHDCFVNGCDASILLDKTPSGETVEKDSPFNVNTLRGLELIDKVKRRLEKICPGVVSCSDILSYATRDASVLAGIPYFQVPGGRRDSRSSLASNIPGNLPTPTSSVSEMIKLFSQKGMSVDQMVVLTGAHSLGVSHCSTVSSRLYNYNLTQGHDPSLDIHYSHYLKFLCPPGASETVVPFDESPTLMDNKFYSNLLQGKALLKSDQYLAHDTRTCETVKRFASNPSEWGTRFGKAMVWLGRVDVLTGRQGEIRKDCRFVN